MKIALRCSLFFAINRANPYNVRFNQMLITNKRFCDFVKISLHKFTYHFISVISQYPSSITLTVFIASFCTSCVEACVAERFITPRTLDLEVRGSSLARRGVFLRQGTVLNFVSLHPGVWMGTGDIHCNALPSCPGGSRNTSSHAPC